MFEIGLFVLGRRYEGFHPRPQFTDVDRLGHVDVTTGIQGFFRIALQGVGGISFEPEREPGARMGDQKWQNPHPPRQEWTDVERVYLAGGFSNYKL